MRTSDFSNNKCYPLEMVNTDSSDSRIRLDCRTGSSVTISNSRIFVFGGCVLPIDIPAGFEIEQLYEKIDSKIKELNTDEKSDKIDYNSYLSAECFRLSLINRKWNHYKLKESLEVPSPRMFHSMSVYDNYIFVMGGLRFDKNNKFEVLNDIWRFDTIDKIWKCYYPNGNDLIMPRYDHVSFVVDTCEMFDASMIHPGLCFTGGSDLNNMPVPKLQLLNVLEERLKPYNFEDLTEFQYLNGEIVCRNKMINLRGSTNGVHGGSCPISNDTRLALFDKTPDVDNFEPFIVFNDSTEGTRLTHLHGFDLSDVNSLTFPVFGTFGECAILCGHSEREKKMLSCVYNIKTGIWTKLHVSCMHKVYSHRLTKGFVWESHHKLAFLGSMNMTEASGSIDYFENLIIMSLPFTNFYSNQPTVNMRQSRTNTPVSGNSSVLSGKVGSDIHSANNISEIRKRSNSVVSEISGLSQNKNNLTPLSKSATNNPTTHAYNPAPLQHSNDHSGGFAGYAYHVAQQIQINSIKSVLPPYAIAIGKSAFERYNSLSDFDLICSDGTIISVPVALCRRRWGDGFDELFSGAFAKAFIEGKAQDLMSSHASTFGSGDSCESNSVNSRFGMNTPYFRYPFQEKDGSGGSGTSSHQNNTFSNFHMNRLDASPNRGLMKSVAANSRHQSVSGNLSSSIPLNRASLSLSLSLSRRNSATATATAHSRHHSFSNHGSRRGSTHVISSRRNSLNIPVGHASRRGSALSRTSFLSSSTSSSNSLHKSTSSLKSNPVLNNLHETSPRSSNSGVPISPVATGSRVNCGHNNEVPSFGNVNFDKKNNKGKDEMKNESIAPNDIEDNLLESVKDDYLEKFEELDLTDIPAPTPMPTVLPSGETMVSSNNDTEGFQDAFRRTTDEKLAELVYGDDFETEFNVNKLNNLRLPRGLYLPYPNDTVHAIVEYLYSGQIGANWKLFPTGLQLLIATKQLSIPLLYDLVLELFFVTLGIIEGACKSKIISHLEKSRAGDSCDDVYHLLDVKGKNDLDADLELLLEAIGNIRRDSGATISHELMIDEEADVSKMAEEEMTEPFDKKRKESQINGVDPLYVGPTDHLKHEVDPKSSVEDKRDTQIRLESNNELRKLSSVERVKITTATLNIEGYEILEDAEDDLSCNFKEFSMDSSEKEKKKESEFEKKKSKKKKKKLKEWPVLKDLLNDELPEETAELVVELLIETGALINDSKLMLQSLHVQELQKKVKYLRNTVDEGGKDNVDRSLGDEGRAGVGSTGIASMPLKKVTNDNSSDSSTSSSCSSCSSSSGGNGERGDSRNVVKGVTSIGPSTAATTATTIATTTATATVQPSNTKAHPSAMNVSGSVLSSGTLSPATSTGPAIGNYDVMKSDENTSAAFQKESVGLGPILSPSSSITSLSSIATGATAIASGMAATMTTGSKNSSGKGKKGFFNRFRRP